MPIWDDIFGHFIGSRLNVGLERIGLFRPKEDLTLPHSVRQCILELENEGEPFWERTLNRCLTKGEPISDDLLVDFLTKKWEGLTAGRKPDEAKDVFKDALKLIEKKIKKAKSIKKGLLAEIGRVARESVSSKIRRKLQPTAAEKKLLKKPISVRDRLRYLPLIVGGIILLIVIIHLIFA